MGPHEQRLVDLGFEVTEQPLEEQPDPEIIGVLAMRPVDDQNTQWWLHVRTGTSPELREVFAEWAYPRIERFFSATDYDDVWQSTSTGLKQSWARLQFLPDV